MLGKKLYVPMEDRSINIVVVDPIFLDKENKKLNA
jgi:sarcosine oxidase subunit alpha